MSQNTSPTEILPPERHQPEHAAPTVDAGPPTTSWTLSQKNWLFAATLVAAVFLVYQPAWEGGFVWDDHLHLVDNPVLKTDGLARAWIPGSYINYWPVTFTVYRLEYEIWGLDTLGFHLVNIALHALSALLLWRVLVELGVPGAMMAAAIFALHPVNVESVAWIAQLKGILSLLFAMVLTLLYLQYDRRGGWWRHAAVIKALGQSPDRFRDCLLQIAVYIAALAAFALSTLAKGMVITLPIVLLACIWWRRGSIKWYDLLRILPYVLIGAIMTRFEIVAQQMGGDSDDVRNDSLLSRAGVAGSAVWFYLGKLLWPVDLCFIYPRWKIEGGDGLFYLPGLLLLAIVFALAVWQRRSWGRPVVMLIVCYVALLLPALGFVKIYFMKWSLVADHWQYAAMIIPCAVLTGVVASWTYRQPGRGPAAVAVGLSLLLILGGLTWRQSRMWTDKVTLFETTIERNPGCWMAYNHLGFALAERGELGNAILNYQKALDAKPDYYEAYNNLGLALARGGQLDEAIIQFHKALEIKPDYFDAYINTGNALIQRGQADQAIAQFHKALEIKPDSSVALTNLGLTLASRGQVEEAIACYRKALESKPDSAETNFCLGYALAGRGQIDEAIEYYLKALESKPDYAEAHNYLGSALASQNKMEDAIIHFREAVESKPDFFEAHNNLGLVLAGRKQFGEAVTHLRKALEIKPDYYEARTSLGNALAGRGDIDEAIVQYQKVLEIKPKDYATHYNLATLLTARGQSEEAIAHYRKVLEIKPDYISAHINLAATLANRGQYDEAIAHYRKVLVIKPDYLAAHINLGLTLEGRGKIDEALDHFQKALDLALAGNDKNRVDAIREKISGLRR